MVQGHLVQAHTVCPEFDMGLERTAVYLGLTKLKTFSVKPSQVIHCTCHVSFFLFHDMFKAVRRH